MIRLFNRKKVSIHSISIPHFGWFEEKSNQMVKEWVNTQKGMTVSVNFFNLQPDLPSIKNIDEVRNFYRQVIAQANGGIVEVDKIQLKGYDTIRTIFKFPQEPFGMAYIASLTIPFESCSYVVKVIAPEIGTTGMRDNVVAMQLLTEGTISLGDKGYEGWFQDPYDPEIKEGILMNKSEATTYDAQFPDHPLSKVRELLGQIEAEIKFGKELERIGKFEE
ncbi:hypothetical protein POV27_05140 [Aureisphaera galaxeae]|uniref:hypothetical protein n=1 Tax=Aureisphaera galaxeae TaxID=1538023 RepID=UPI00234FCB11|nr:hypothetical protein [Aureisphaera galaxeae]MDC8003424.1 hypothetical protein [Aureisphaera galaxeae]